MAVNRDLEFKKEEIRDAADIYEVVSDYVKLKRAGNSFTGLCPFHNEKTPSFNVNSRLGIFKCFGCGAGGDVFSFLMDMEGISFPEAMRSLADRYNIELPDFKQDKEEYSERESLTEGVYHALRFAGIFFHEQLMDVEIGVKALNYLQGRELQIPTIRKWGLGFAPDGFQNLYNKATSSGINEQYLAEAGLIKYSERDQKPYDVFRGRVMFPIFNRSGKIIGFGGRSFEDAKGPKYLNSPETIVYHKSEVIYGIHQAKHEIRKEGEVFLVEGYMDVVSLWQAGIKNVVATSGTAITEKQIQVLNTFSNQLIMLYDSDNAGQNAMVKGLEIGLNAGMVIKLMHLPDGEDPDSFVRQYGGESLKNLKDKEARDFISFLIEKAERSDDWEDPSGRRKTVAEALRMIALISEPVMREVHLDQLARKSSLSKKVLEEELNRNRASLQQEREKDAQREQRRRQHNTDATKAQAEAHNTSGNENRTRKNTAPAAFIPDLEQRRPPPYEKEIIRLMVEQGEEMIFYISNFINESYFETKEMQDFYLEIIRRYEEEEEISVAAFARLHTPFPQLTGDIFIEKYTISEKHSIVRSGNFHRDSDPYATARGALKPITIAYLKRCHQKHLALLQSEPEQSSNRNKLYEEFSTIIKDLTYFQKNPADKSFTHQDDIFKGS
ncbi:MAG: DNA primase [Balneolales bacterium]|nr:DNA primase [Balneolales bacterium]